jgi:hypothetical protein
MCWIYFNTGGLGLSMRGGGGDGSCCCKRKQDGEGDSTYGNAGVIDVIVKAENSNYRVRYNGSDEQM